MNVNSKEEFYRDIQEVRKTCGSLEGVLIQNLPKLRKSANKNINL